MYRRNLAGRVGVRRPRARTNNGTKRQHHLYQLILVFILACFTLMGSLLPCHRRSVKFCGIQQYVQESISLLHQNSNNKSSSSARSHRRFPTTPTNERSTSQDTTKPSKALWQATLDSSNALEGSTSVLNLHAHYELTCNSTTSSNQDVVHPSIPNYIDMVKSNLEADVRDPPQEYTKFGHFWSSTVLSRLTTLQQCTYSVLEQWNQLAQQHGIQTWAAHGGTAIGARCLGSMNPWDDDIDISVWNCSILDQLWENGRQVSDVHPDIDIHEYRVDKAHQSFEPKLIDDDLILLKGGRCCNWYKLKSVQQCRNKIKADPDIVGLDIECMALPTFENKVRKQAGWDDYMAQNGPMDTVMFGPTSVQVLPEPMLDAYIEYRYGKKDPCTFPFRNGQDPVPTVLPKNKRPKSDDHNGLLYLPDIRRNSLHWVMGHWYTSKYQRTLWKRRVALFTQEHDFVSEIPNLNTVEVDNSIAPTSCWSGNDTTIHVVTLNAERGKHWDKFVDNIQSDPTLRNASVILVNNLDIGMARSGNLHTARRMAIALDMNYAFALESIELTRGTKEEEQSTRGQRDALSLHGHAILAKCSISNPLVVRERFPKEYLSLQTGERRIGGHIGLLARLTSGLDSAQSSSIAVGNIHVPSLSSASRAAISNYTDVQDHVLISGESEGDLCGEMELIPVVTKDISAAGCGIVNLPRMNPYTLCSNVKAFTYAVQGPCYGGNNLLGITSALSSRAITTATLKL